jgi:dienelactone hydrolase
MNGPVSNVVGMNLPDDDVSEWIEVYRKGGAVALMTAPEVPEIKAVASEAVNSSLSEMSQELYAIPVVRKPLGWFTGMWACLLLRINISEVSPVKAVTKLNIPVLITHSQNDQTIPFSHAQTIQRALEDNSQAAFWFPEQRSFTAFITGSSTNDFWISSRKIYNSSRNFGCGKAVTI